MKHISNVILTRIAEVFVKKAPFLNFHLYELYQSVIYMMIESDLSQEALYLDDLLLYLFLSLLFFPIRFEAANILILMCFVLITISGYMGEGDLILLMIFSIFLDQKRLTLVLMSASFFALVYVIITKKRRLPFAPFLLLGFYLVQSRIWNILYI